MDTVNEACALEGMDFCRVVDHLTYAAYKFNRSRAPEIAASRWIAIFPEAAEYEARYQEELAHA